ncbi:MAG: type II secretion system F family protein [Actinomycetota bacterium]|nr:type II secretion system F family protein [Actinomycetota bacterium]
MITLTIFTLTFLAAFLAVAAILTLPLASRARVKQSLTNLSAYDQVGRAEAVELPFMDRVVWPLVERFSELAKRYTEAGRLEKIRHKLILGGVRKLDAERFASIKMALVGAGLLIYLLFFLPWAVVSGRPVWLGLPFIVIAFWLPDIWLSRQIEDRQRRIGTALADSIDILTISIEAGLAFDSALAKVVKNIGGPLSEELGRMLGELQIGVSRREALRALADRTTISELQNFCATIIQAETLGISIGKILKTEAKELRTRRRQAAEEQAMKTPVKLVFPIVLCILPAIMIVILGPAAIRIGGTLLNAF